MPAAPRTVSDDDHPLSCALRLAKRLKWNKDFITLLNNVPNMTTQKSTHMFCGHYPQLRADLLNYGNKTGSDRQLAVKACQELDQQMIRAIPCNRPLCPDKREPRESALGDNQLFRLKEWLQYQSLYRPRKQMSFTTVAFGAGKLMAAIISTHVLTHANDWVVSTAWECIGCIEVAGFDDPADWFKLYRAVYDPSTASFGCTGNYIARCQGALDSVLVAQFTEQQLRHYIDSLYDDGEQLAVLEILRQVFGRLVKGKYHWHGGHRQVPYVGHFAEPSRFSSNLLARIAGAWPLYRWPGASLQEEYVAAMQFRPQHSGKELKRKWRKGSTFQPYETYRVLRHYVSVDMAIAHHWFRVSRGPLRLLPHDAVGKVTDHLYGEGHSYPRGFLRKLYHQQLSSE